MKAIELLQYLKDGMDTGYPPKHIINDAIKEIERLEQSNKDLLNTIIEAQEVIKNVLEGKNEMCKH